MVSTTIRVLLAKAGLEGHDPALIAMACALKEAGMEVIYLGIHQSVESVVRAAIEEGVHAVALTASPGAHRQIFPAVVRSLREAGRDILVTGAAEMVQGEREFLQGEGAGTIFEPAGAGPVIAEYIRSWDAQKKNFRSVSKKSLVKA